MSPVHTSVSVQSASALQQLGTAAFAHFPAVHLSVVQAFESLQSRSTLQHPAILGCSHRFVVRLHESVVHVSVSGHSVFALQQSVATGNEHTWVVVLHVSFVQGLVSAQSLFALQHAALAVCVHWLAVQASVVQAFESSQSATVWQQPVRGACVQTLEAQESIVHGLPSSQSMSGVGVAVVFWQQFAIFRVATCSRRRCRSDSCTRCRRRNR
jgi:hypothetical protein